MGIYDRDYMKRPPDDRRHSSTSPRSRGSRPSLEERLESISEILFTKHRKVMAGILTGLIGLALITFILLKLD